MKRLHRRAFLGGTAGSALALSMRSAIMGLPMSFLLTGDVHAAEVEARTTILGLSAAGEALNVCGPGTFEPGQEAFFDHPRADAIDTDKLAGLTVDGVPLTGEHLEQPVQLELGSSVVRLARAFEVLPEQMRRHLAFFYYRTNAGIHPQFDAVLKASGDLLAANGRGSEVLPSAIAQDIAAQLGTITARPFVMSGSLSYNSAPLPSYSPTQVKQLAGSVGRSVGGPENFAALYDHYIDEAYAEVRLHGTSAQRRFFDQHASSRTQAAAFGDGLGQLLEDVDGDDLENQLRTAVVIAKLRLSPVVVVGLHFGGDGHGDSDLSEETAQTLTSLKAMHAYWNAASDLGVLDETFYATATVFGRDNRRSASGGRGHNGPLCAGLLVGTHSQGGVVGGFDLTGRSATSAAFNSTTGTTFDPDVHADDSLASYYRTVMRLAGVPEAMREVRLPNAREVLALG